MSMIDEASSPQGRLWSLFRSHRGRPIHKWTQYFPAYERHLQRFVGTSPFMLEIGCGLGGSLEMWQTYFGEGCRIVGIDIRPECAEYARPEKGIEVRIGDQSDPRFLASLIEEFGIPDIVLDDGSHVMKHVNGTFDYLYEKTSPNGVYLVEDLHTAYWPQFGGGLRQPTSFIERSKGLLDEMHHRYTDGVVPPTNFSESTESVHVYDSLIAFERRKDQQRLVYEIGGSDNSVTDTTSLILSLGRGAAQAAAQTDVVGHCAPVSQASDLGSYLSPASFWMPDKIVSSAWLQHGPFAFWIVEAMQPRCIVELGTHHGFSYLAFCQAVRRLGLPTKCFAVDTWQGDEHVGRYPDAVYTNLKAYHDPRFSDFSRMVRLRFDEAAKHFADGSVDLLHIDGRHFYEDAKEDFEVWLPKLSDRAVVLFHDTNVRERNFGVWKLWQQLSAKYPSFEFVHGHGLGVLGVGADLPPRIRALFDAGASSGPAIRETYYRLGLSVQDRFALHAKRPPDAPQAPKSEAKPAAPPPAAPAIVAKPATTLHIHLAAMSPLLLDVRTYLPLRELAKVPGIATSSSNRKIEFPRLPVELPKVMILQRFRIEKVDEWAKGVKHLSDQGWIVIDETDDHPALIGQVFGRAVDDVSWYSSRLVHAVQTSTVALAEAIRPYNPEVAIFRNAVFTPPVPPRRRSGSRLKVFYGALNREGFSAQVGAALAPFAAAHPDIEFVVMHDRAFFDALGACNKTFHPLNEDYAAYMALMAACDVCLMPLEGKVGELYKSDLKFVEASNLGLASIASPAVYGGTIVDGATGLIAPDVQDWPRQLEKLMRDETLRYRLSESAQTYVARERVFSQQIDNRLAWYSDLWARKSDLGLALQRRLSIIESERESQSAITG